MREKPAKKIDGIAEYIKKPTIQSELFETRSLLEYVKNVGLMASPIIKIPWLAFVYTTILSYSIPKT